MKGNQIWEEITSHTVIPSVPTGSVGNGRPMSRANRAIQDSQFHDTDKGYHFKAQNSAWYQN